MLEEGKELIISFPGYQSSSYAVTSGDWQINLARSVTRLKSLFLSFRKHDGKKSNSLQYPSTNADAFQAQVQIGAKNFPDSKITSTAEFWPRLMAACGNHTSVLATSAIDVSNGAYTGAEFIAGFSCEKVLSESGETNMSGLNTKSGDLITVRTFGVTAGTTGNQVAEGFVCIVHDSILAISDEGCRIFT